ncbi:endonuclease NucS [Ferruginibacter lapsinanis]|uniref:endonuclease NucS domain-containing protein n=1 Tax=Ferruginibacter lapsinanis TaxID=563172 RepID=UPI001E577AE1|nr:endonuclease NucS domain-containing protein [Ferruginibacter lapsinanis]UEG49075.1 endonuclease NucS [Ferruginibacter lapsinanis]
MTLEDYKIWYTIDEGHWYVSKVKQYKPSAIQKFAKGLAIIANVINAEKDSEMYKGYFLFKPKEENKLFPEEKKILIDEYSVLFICLNFLLENLLDQSHLEATNFEKFQEFSTIQREFLEGKNYEYFINKYTKKYLTDELSVYYRNFKSWLGKFGFYGEYENKTAFITEMGYELIENRGNSEKCSALFSHQVKKFQLWNPTIKEKYRDYKIRPYYLLLEVLGKLPDRWFSKIEYALFITKIKSHNERIIADQIEFIKQWRELSPEEQQKFIDELNFIDKKKFRRRPRTNFNRLLDSASKEIDCYGYGGLIEKGEGLYQGKYILADYDKAMNELNLFSTGARFIEFEKKLDWIAHLGSKQGLSIDDILDLYLANGVSLEFINDEFKNNQSLKDSIQDKIYEKEIEEYYVNNIKEIHKDLEVLTKPTYGRQYSTHIGPIDILCFDVITNEYVICELKRGQTSDETVGQLLRYMGWVKKHLVFDGKNVRGILVGADFNEKIDYSLLGMQNSEVDKIIGKFNHPFNDNNRPPQIKKRNKN